MEVLVRHAFLSHSPRQFRKMITNGHTFFEVLLITTRCKHAAVIEERGEQ